MEDRNGKETYNEKLSSPWDLPKIEDLSGKPKAVKRLGGVKMLVATSAQHNGTTAKIPKGKLTTADRIRTCPAAQAGADATCLLTAGIFTNICAHASEERGSSKIPWWRTLKAKGGLNEKYSGGIDGQKLLPETEGHTIVQKGKRYFVRDHENKLADLD